MKVKLFLGFKADPNHVGFNTVVFAKIFAPEPKSFVPDKDFTVA
jgi:hypothetical protein